MKYHKAWIVLLMLAILTPLGIIAAGGAWGEWDLDGVRERVGFVPEGMRSSASGATESPLEEYTVPGLDGSFFRKGLGTIMTAMLGAGVTALLAFAVARIAGHGRIS
ncbi:MAG: cobalamin biosynthesis protein [Candidatus Krumholzibacteria bacterium]|nr:cobalamin biosynthesis protein [Candidatus Krumholzibacteria bacterium]